MPWDGLIYGWRARIGRITPSASIEGIEEMRRWAPEGVVVMPSLIPIRSLAAADLEDMMRHLERAAIEVADMQPNVIVQCCAAATISQGPGADARAIQVMESATNVPSTTMMQATIDALRHLGLTRLAVGTAYGAALNEKLSELLEVNGFTVDALVGLDTVNVKRLAYTNPAEAYRVSLQAFLRSGSVDGILFTGGGVRSFEIIETLERDTGRPVVSSNQAALWKVLAMAGVNATVPQLGVLLAPRGEMASDHEHSQV
jgi:maleate cis-trans isomerase